MSRPPPSAALEEPAEQTEEVAHLDAGQKESHPGH